MELKRRFNFRRVVSIIYVLLFAIYIAVGLQPADAVQYEISGELKIPAINLVSDVTTLKLEDHKLNTPETIVGSYTRTPSKIFLIGHSSTVFKNLNQTKINDEIEYNNKFYEVINTEIFKKDDIDMTEVLASTKRNTLIIMTCAGIPMGEHDATHRLIVTALEK